MSSEIFPKKNLSNFTFEIKEDFIFFDENYYRKPNSFFKALTKSAEQFIFFLFAI